MRNCCSGVTLPLPVGPQLWSTCDVTEYESTVPARRTISSAFGELWAMTELGIRFLAKEFSQQLRRIAMPLFKYVS